jgi:uncharacterized protein (DUF169 family)
LALDYQMISERLKETLGLTSEPVGLKLLQKLDEVSGYHAENKYTFCQFIMKAREGNKLLATADSIACANGASALGFIPVPEKLLNGEFLSKLGSFQKEGAQKTMERMPRFQQNQFAGIALAPLAEVTFEPDIIILETLPEQLMWLSLASIHQHGGRLEFTSSISNGACVDTTVVPYLEQKLNVSLGCYGCRNATSIPDEHLLAGFPAKQVQQIVDALEALSDKTMSRTREKRAYTRLQAAGDSGK